MDSREPPPQRPQMPGPPHLPPHHHHQLNHHMISPYSSSSIINSNNTTSNPNNSSIPNPNSASSGFPFNSVGPPPPRPQPKPSDGGILDGSSPPSSGIGFSIEPAKKKRGRPRKYTPDGNIGLALSPTVVSSSGAAASAGYGDSRGGSGTHAGGGGSSEQPAKRNRGRPPGSGKKQLDALGGVGGIGFTPHVIVVNAGEDIATKITSFLQQGPRSFCILSANGAVRNVSLRQASSGGTVSYEGFFEIISLSGSYLTSDDNSGPKTSGALSVSLAGADGRVLGGRVAGTLMAATAVQVIVGSFVADRKKSSSHISKPGPSPLPGSQMLNFGAPLTASTPSQDDSSESDDDSGSSPVNRGPAIYGNSGLPMHSLQMYQLWTGQNPQ